MVNEESGSHPIYYMCSGHQTYITTEIAGEVVVKVKTEHLQETHYD